MSYSIHGFDRTGKELRPNTTGLVTLQAAYCSACVWLTWAEVYRVDIRDVDGQSVNIFTKDH